MNEVDGSGGDAPGGGVGAAAEDAHPSFEGTGTSSRRFLPRALSPPPPPPPGLRVSAKHIGALYAPSLHSPHPPHHYPSPGSAARTRPSTTASSRSGGRSGGA